MATQGMVSVLKDNTVVMKIIAGSEGQKAEAVAEQINAAWPVSLQDAYYMCLENGFGSKESLVAMEKGRAIYEEESVAPSDQFSAVDERFFDTFGNPEFNPRWECGAVDYLSIVNI